MIGGSQILSVEQEVGGSSPPNCTIRIPTQNRPAHARVAPANPAQRAAIQRRRSFIERPQRTGLPAVHGQHRRFRQVTAHTRSSSVVIRKSQIEYKQVVPEQGANRPQAASILSGPPGTFIPSLSPSFASSCSMLAMTFRPTPGLQRRSTSERCTKSPTYTISSFFRQLAPAGYNTSSSTLRSKTGSKTTSPAMTNGRGPTGLRQ